MYDDGLSLNNVNFVLNQASKGGALFVSDESYEDVCFNNPLLKEIQYSLTGGCFFQNVTNSSISILCTINSQGKKLFPVVGLVKDMCSFYHMF